MQAQAPGTSGDTRTYIKSGRERTYILSREWFKTNTSTRTESGVECPRFG